MKNEIDNPAPPLKKSATSLRKRLLPVLIVFAVVASAVDAAVDALVNVVIAAAATKYPEKAQRLKNELDNPTTPLKKRAIRLGKFLLASLIVSGLVAIIWGVFFLEKPEYHGPQGYTPSYSRGR